MSDRPFVRTWRVTYVLSRRGGHWQEVAEHTSRNAGRWDWRAEWET